LSTPSGSGATGAGPAPAVEIVAANRPAAANALSMLIIYAPMKVKKAAARDRSR
jgi:hypothetical protein